MVLGRKTSENMNEAKQNKFITLKTGYYMGEMESLSSALFQTRWHHMLSPSRMDPIFPPTT